MPRFSLTFPSPTRRRVEKRYYFRGNRKTLRFSSNHSIWRGQKGYVVVDYRVEVDPSGKEVLYASEKIPGIEGRQDTRLIEATEISFEYFYKDPAEEQGKWLDQMPEGTVIPEKIRFRVTNGTKTLSLVYPVRVRGEDLDGSGRRIQMKASQRGIALLIVLWVMAILMVTVLSFSMMIRAEAYGTLAFKERVEKKRLAEAGIERGIMEIAYRSVHRNRTATLEGTEAWKLDGTAYTVDMGKGGFAVRVIDESGKISLNGLTDSSGIILKNLLIREGVSPENAEVIVDSILDWKDADDLHRLNGAETDYYLSLSKPYKARNADFETPEELILVKGMTPEILYGTGKTRGIIHFLTVHGKSGRININAAPREVLEAFPGMDAAMADRIVEFRKSSEIAGDNGAKEMLGAAYPLVAPYVSATSVSSGMFTLESTGYHDDPKKGFSIVAIISFDGSNRYRYLYYKSPVEIST